MYSAQNLEAQEIALFPLLCKYTKLFCKFLYERGNKKPLLLLLLLIIKYFVCTRLQHYIKRLNLTLEYMPSLICRNDRSLNNAKLDELLALAWKTT